MKKFVSMEVINKVFDDVPIIDYITVDSVSDSDINLVIYLKAGKVPVQGTKWYVSLNDHCLVLGKMLDRKVQFQCVPAPWYATLKYKVDEIFSEK